MHTLNTASEILAIFIEALTGDLSPVTIFDLTQYVTFGFSIFRADTHVNFLTLIVLHFFTSCPYHFISYKEPITSLDFYDLLKFF